VLIISQPHRRQQAGSQLLKALMKLFGHKIEPAITKEKIDVMTPFFI
jgi:hypothetical protein